MDKVIIHIDMDAFYAAVEVRDNPELSGKPVIIGAMPGTRGVVSTCSYEARKLGVRSAMSISEAYRRCPNGIYLTPNMGKYAAESEKIHRIMATYTDIIEYVSLDEGYMDVTNSVKLFGSAENIAMGLKNRIKEQTGLSCSVGIGYSMLAAKLASEEKKPDGFFIIPDPDFFVNLIIDRNIGVIHGVGKKTVMRLGEKGFVTVRDLLSAKPDSLDFLGNTGREILMHARGIDNRSVTPNESAKSVGREYTFQHDLTEREEIDEILHYISRQVSYQLKSKELRGKTVTLKIKFSDMKLITRSKTEDYTNSARKIRAAATEMLGGIELLKAVRLVGISVSNMEGEEVNTQLSFDDFLDKPQSSRDDKIEDMIFKINKTVGKGTIKTGREMLAEQNFKDR